MNLAQLMALCDRQEAEAEFAARQWCALREALGLDAQATARGVVTEIERLTEVLLRVQAILPEVLTCPWGSRERKATLLRLVEEAEPKSLLFDAALRDADELTLRYALALAVGDEVREGELKRRLAEIEVNA